MGTAGERAAYSQIYCVPTNSRMFMADLQQNDCSCNGLQPGAVADVVYLVWLGFVADAYLDLCENQQY